jgi:AcrR family transcriptional regulator
MAAKEPSLERKIALAALKCAAKEPWHDVTLVQIAETAKAPLKQVQKLFPDTANILPAIVRLIDADMTKAVGKTDRKTSVHDRLFEILMARFDALQQHRAGILSLASACRQIPSLAKALLKAQWESMRLVARLARLEEEGAHDLLRRAGLLAIYHVILCRWVLDDSADLAKTMAALDRTLSRSGALARIFLKRY